jgi:hypothetical protein
MNQLKRVHIDFNADIAVLLQTTSARYVCGSTLFCLIPCTVRHNPSSHNIKEGFIYLMAKQSY